MSWQEIIKEPFHTRGKQLIYVPEEETAEGRYGEQGEKPDSHHRDYIMNSIAEGIDELEGLKEVLEREGDIPMLDYKKISDAISEMNSIIQSVI